MRIRDWSSDVCSSDLDAGVDLSYHNKDDWTTETTYFEKACFKPIPMQENGQQVLWGLHYSMTAWRHGEEAMDPFHDEVGFLLWDKAHGEAMRRSEEHTSELQSLMRSSYAVFCLKKNNTTHNTHIP